MRLSLKITKVDKQYWSAIPRQYYPGCGAIARDCVGNYLPRNSYHSGGSNCKQINPAPIRMMPEIKIRKLSQDRTITTINPAIPRRIPVLPIFFIMYILIIHLIRVLTGWRLA